MGFEGCLELPVEPFDDSVCDRMVGSCVAWGGRGQWHQREHL